MGNRLLAVNKLITNQGVTPITIIASAVKTMARLYQKIYAADSLCCPKCGGEMKIISFITDQEVIRQILKHLGLWTPMPSRDPPATEPSPKNHELVYELFDDMPAFNIQADDWPGYDESCVAQN